MQSESLSWLDKPLIVQFANWFGGLFRGDIGRSVFTDKSVGSMMLPRIQPTVALAIMSVILSVAFGSPNWFIGRVESEQRAR